MSFKAYDDWIRDGYRVFSEQDVGTDVRVLKLLCDYANHAVDIRLDGRHHLCFLKEHPDHNKNALTQMISYAIKEKVNFELGLTSKDAHFLTFDYEDAIFKDKLLTLQDVVNLCSKFYSKEMEIFYLLSNCDELLGLSQKLPDLLADKVFEAFKDVFDFIVNKKEKNNDGQ